MTVCLISGYGGAFANTSGSCWWSLASKRTPALGIRYFVYGCCVCLMPLGWHPVTGK